MLRDRGRYSSGKRRKRRSYGGRRRGHNRHVPAHARPPAKIGAAAGPSTPLPVANSQTG
ncbi:hypothetical protein YPPY66_2455, partial [Yersinia pestis PY-66]